MGGKKKVVSLQEVIKTQKELCDEARAIIAKKGADYNRAQQLKGDTLFNLRVSTILGITESTTQGLLTRITDKHMRIISLTKKAGIKAAVKDESVKDTIKDTINYLSYLYILWNEANKSIARKKKLKNKKRLKRKNVKSRIKK